jgi:UDP-N-acetylglucosamine 2-epimerase (non-hydrolysing)
MKKIMTIVGTRPEIIKLSRVIAELEKYTNHILVHTGQNYDYELNAIFFEQLEVKKPNYFLDAAGKNASETIGKVIMHIDPILERENPDALLIYGDTNSCLSVIPAKRRKIPIFHMEAGNRCFDQRVPEEINRKIVDHLSDINIPLSEHARNYLLREGIRPETIIKTGSCLKEVLNYYNDNIQKSNVLNQLSLTPKKYFVVSIHREENVDSEDNFTELLTTLDVLADTYGIPVLISTHPRTRKKLESIGYLQKNKLLQFLVPFGFFEYIKLQENALCVISDSGTITEESSILKFPAIMIRHAHERPEGMDEGTVIMAGLNSTNVIEAINVVVDQSRIKNSIRIISDYDTENVSVKIVRIILSYIEYINRVVWQKLI